MGGRWTGGREVDGWEGGGRVGGGWGGAVGGGGRCGAEGGAKHPFGLKRQCCAFSKCHELIQSTRPGGPDCREEQFGTPCSPINAPQDHEMHPRGFTASAKSRL